jgi:hypothetical protein
VLVIPIPRRLRVRDLLFTRKLGKKQIPHPVKNQTERHIFEFFRSLLRHDRKLGPTLDLRSTPEPERVDPLVDLQASCVGAKSPVSIA